MTKHYKKVAVAAVLNLALMLTGNLAKAEGVKHTKIPLLKTASCFAGRALGLCSSDTSVSPRSLSLGVFTAVNTAKAAPNRLLEIAKLFIDNLEVAQIGNTKIKVSLELR
jgi:hypothetical protein